MKADLTNTPLGQGLKSMLDGLDEEEKCIQCGLSKKTIKDKQFYDCQAKDGKVYNHHKYE